MTSVPLKPYSVIDQLGRLLYFGLAIELPELEEHQRLIHDQPPSANHFRDGDEWVELPPRPFPYCEFDYVAKMWADARPIDEVRGEQLKKIDAGFDEAAQALTAGYPLTEQMTWATQQTEALAWSRNPDAPTPYLDGIADERGIERIAMRAKTLQAVKGFLALSQKLVGRRQRLRDHALAAETREAINAASWID